MIRNRNQNNLLFQALENVEKACESCHTSPPRPVAGLSMATRFQEIIAMDLKVYDSRIMLHLIDHATRLPVAK